MTNDQNEIAIQSRASNPGPGENKRSKEITIRRASNPGSGENERRSNKITWGVVIVVASYCGCFREYGEYSENCDGLRKACAEHAWCA
jgi:hypothetical protein